MVHHPFFFNDTATTEIYTLSLHDALPISKPMSFARSRFGVNMVPSIKGKFIRLRPSPWLPAIRVVRDRKSTRLNSSHANISYAVFCLKKKNTNLFQHWSTSASSSTYHCTY